MRREILIALVLSVALAIAILSLPDVLIPVAQSMLKAMGLYWPAAIFLIGVIHGLKPDEHTWPITVSYGIMQRSKKGALLTTSVFAAALTLVWSSLSALTSELLSFFRSYNVDPLVDIVVGLTMMGVASVLMLQGKGESRDEEGADYRVVWIHGVAAAFGGDFVIVLLLTVALGNLMETNLGFAIGLLFGLGSWIAQSLVVLLIYSGLIRQVRDFGIMVRAGRISLLLLGTFMIGLGVYSYLY